MKYAVLSVVILLVLQSCNVSKKIDENVAGQYGYRLPRALKKKEDSITVVSALKPDSSVISKTLHVRDQFLPLLVFWKIDHRYECMLNSSIPVTQFANALHKVNDKALAEKLKGRRLLLTVEQAPTAFSIKEKIRVYWALLYAFHTTRDYVDPEIKDMVVSYQLMEDSNMIKSGKIVVKNSDNKKNIRWLQSYKSAVSEYLTRYNAAFTDMAKSFATQLAGELAAVNNGKSE